MSIEDDRKCGQVHMSANQLAFKDPDMQSLLSSQGFTIPRCTVQVNRLIARAADVQQKYDNRKNKKDKMSQEDADIIRDGKNAQELLDIIEKPIDGQS